MCKKLLMIIVIWCCSCMALVTQAQITPPTKQHNYQVMKILRLKIAENAVVVLKNISYKLQSQQSQVDVAVNLFYPRNRSQVNYIDSKDLVAHIKKYLSHQQGKNIYWEKINHNLAIYLLKNYSQLVAIRSTFLIHSDKKHPFAQQSMVFIRR